MDIFIGNKNFLHQMKLIRSLNAGNFGTHGVSEMGMKHVFAAAIIGLAAALPAHAADKDIVDTAVAAGDFKTLAAALEAADLVDGCADPCAVSGYGGDRSGRTRFLALAAGILASRNRRGDLPAGAVAGLAAPKVERRRRH